MKDLKPEEHIDGEQIIATELPPEEEEAPQGEFYEKATAEQIMSLDDDALRSENGGRYHVYSMATTLNEYADILIRRAMASARHHAFGEAWGDLHQVVDIRRRAILFNDTQPDIFDFGYFKLKEVEDAWDRAVKIVEGFERCMARRKGHDV